MHGVHTTQAPAAVMRRTLSNKTNPQTYLQMSSTTHVYSQPINVF